MEFAWAMCIQIIFISRSNSRIVRCEPSFGQVAHDLSLSRQFMTGGYRDRYTVFILHPTANQSQREAFDLMGCLLRKMGKTKPIANERAQNWLGNTHHKSVGPSRGRTIIHSPGASHNQTTAFRMPVPCWRMHFNHSCESLTAHSSIADSNCNAFCMKKCQFNQSFMVVRWHALNEINE